MFAFHCGLFTLLSFEHAVVFLIPPWFVSFIQSKELHLTLCNPVDLINETKPRSMMKNTKVIGIFAKYSNALSDCSHSFIQYISFTTVEITLQWGRPFQLLLD